MKRRFNVGTGRKNRKKKDEKPPCQGCEYLGYWHSGETFCSYFGEAIEDAYLVDCPCRVEVSTITTEVIEKMTRLAKGSTSWFAEIRGE